MADRWVNTEEAAQHIGLAVSTLEKARLYGNSPPYSKAGRSVRYRLSDLDSWMNARVVESTSEQRLVA